MVGIRRECLDATALSRVNPRWKPPVTQTGWKCENTPRNVDPTFESISPSKEVKRLLSSLLFESCPFVAIRFLPGNDSGDARRRSLRWFDRLERACLSVPGEYAGQRLENATESWQRVCSNGREKKVGALSLNSRHTGHYLLQRRASHRQWC